ncbi:C40 family peptidase [Paenibacillus contaminans]|uniref:NlpC/P60 family protein n=1 Tax=Paenibacillus contaminans TaxID=450362 RepID=A0A329LYZ2_9BACL|nr:C40 family peptidase [Paenibacillus contaminans]RAV12502.1 NlpC/P60 family protein [Paenibacillus contaminans]
MKKAVVFFVSIVMFLSFMASSVSAETPLNAAVDELIGTPYRDGGMSEKGFDCSGFTKFLFDKLGIELTRTSRSQNTEGYWVDKSDLRAGDLVFFNTSGKGISHVGVYLGDGVFAHSASDEGVTKSKLSEKYYKERYVSARRVMWDDIYNQLTTEKSE